MKKDDRSTYILSARAHTELLTYCQSELPNEACGLLISSRTIPNTIDIVHPIPNVHPAPRSAFAFDPAGWIASMYHLEANEQQLFGYYHSHPRSAPVPSQTDSTGILSQAGAITLIVSFSTGEPVMKAYWKPSDEWKPVELHIEYAQTEETD
jgi:proteasome lid subunit RPN8/RPN11